MLTALFVVVIFRSVVEDYVMLRAIAKALNEHLSYKRGVARPKMATGSNYFKKL